MTALGISASMGLGLAPRGGGAAALHALDQFAMNVTDHNYYTPQLYYANIAKYGRWRRSTGLSNEVSATYVDVNGDLIAMRAAENYVVYTPRSGSAATQRFKATWTGAALCTGVAGTGGSVSIISNVANQVIFTVTYTSAASHECAALTFGYSASANPVVGLDVREVDGSNVPLHSGTYHPTGYNRDTRYNGLRFLDVTGFVNSSNEFRTINWADRTPAGNRHPQYSNTQATLTLGTGNAALNFTAISGYFNGYGYKADSINSYGHVVGANGNNISVVINAASGAGSVSVSQTGASIDIVVVPAAAATTAMAVAAQITADTIAGPLVSVTAGGTGADAVATAAKTYLAGGLDAQNPCGMPVEDRVAFCNAANCDLWFPLGANVTTDFVTGFCTYVRDNLNPNLRLFLGLSNEVWNTSSPYFNGQIALAAIARQQGLVTTIGSGSAATATRRGYAYKFNEIMTVAETVFASQRTRLVRCGEYLQHALASTSNVDLLLKPSGAGSEAASYIGSHVDMVCTAPYYALRASGTTVNIFTKRNAWATATAYAVGEYFYSLTTSKMYMTVVAHTSSGADPSTDETAGKTVEMTAANLDPYVRSAVINYSAANMTTYATQIALYTNDLGVQIKYGCYEAGQQFFISSDAPGQTLQDTYTAALYKSAYFKTWEGILYDQFRRLPNSGSMWTTNNINGPFLANSLGFGVEQFPWSSDADSPRRIAFENADAGIFPTYYLSDPSLSGVRTVGSVLTLTIPTAYNATTATLQWLRDGADLGSPVDVTGQSSSTYTQVAGDDTHVIEARVTLANANFTQVYTTTGGGATSTITPPSYTFLGENLSTAASSVHTYSVDIGTAAADRYILLVATVQNADPVPISVTVAGVALTLLNTAGTPSSQAYMTVTYGGLVTAGSGAQNAVVTWTSAISENKLMALWSLQDLVSTTPKSSGAQTTTAAMNVTVTSGDLVFFAGSAVSGLTSTFANTSTPAPTGQRAATANLYAADWLISASGTLTINTVATTARRSYVVFA